jgi:nucleoside-diphosphate-sugar epimerase
VEADLNNRVSLFKAVEGCDFVIHTASPFPLLPPKHDSEVIKPAVNGTKAIIEACIQFKIKRVIMTSSTAAISEMKP